ncbi:hypothetical protein SADUNF_Sadunf16G0153200 [Salix dunnii]|uniref:Uncharacterized protein n=1 Tax=Salix dunnii TaxID=1413687 RepID=A0A835MGL5_9ROSI|nr:hypothetical protein SADUNF_Sadunf16G0153200 [Salix dunnii]
MKRSLMKVYHVQVCYSCGRVDHGGLFFFFFPFKDSDKSGIEGPAALDSCPANQRSKSRKNNQGSRFGVLLSVSVDGGGFRRSLLINSNSRKDLVCHAQSSFLKHSAHAATDKRGESIALNEPSSSAHKAPSVQPIQGDEFLDATGEPDDDNAKFTTSGEENTFVLGFPLPRGVAAKYQ